MKYCPVCKIEYSNNAEFCKKCEAKLQEKEDRLKEVKTDYKRLIKMCAYTVGFIIFIMLLYYVFFQVAS
ncbi:MAG: hypothetical protein PHO15_09380 [Eubacteriales bacterium]|nr:hypothetical protein [Eubacteriales bacterium]